MGRLEYLKRMAFGRSPYSNHDEDAATLINHSKDGLHKQYNAKGHPINPAKEQLSTSLRQAQNEVLAVVGVLERRNDASHLARNQQISDREHEHIQQQWLDQRKLEHAGDILRHAAIASMMLTWYPHTLLLRSLAGAYHSDDSLACIIWKAAYASAFVPTPHMLNVYWPGLPFRVAYNELSTLSSWLIDLSLDSSTRNDHQNRQNEPTLAVRNLAMKATAQWCLLPLLQLAISAQLNPSAHKLSNAQDLSRLIGQLQHLLLANFSLQGLSAIVILSLTGAFYAGSLYFLVQRRAAPSAKSVVQYSEDSPAIFTYSRARSATSLFPRVVELLGNVRDSLLAWLDCDIPTQISTNSSRSHMDAGVSHPAVDPHFPENNRSVSDLHASPQPSLRNHVVLERFLSMADAILMQSIQLPVEFLFLHLSARSLGPESNLTSHHSSNANSQFAVLSSDGVEGNIAKVNSLSRVGLSLSLVYLAEMAAFGASRLIVDLIYTHSHSS